MLTSINLEDVSVLTECTEKDHAHAGVFGNTADAGPTLRKIANLGERRLRHFGTALGWACRPPH